MACPLGVVRVQPFEEASEPFDHACAGAGHVDTHEVMAVATVFGALREHYLALMVQIVAQRVGVMRDGRAVVPQQLGGVAFDHDDASAGRHGGVVFVEH